MEAKLMESPRKRLTAALPQVRARSTGRQARGRIPDQRGQAAVEFALVVPVLLTLVIAVAVFGIAFNNDLALTFATSNAAQLLSISRGQTTDPCKTTSQAVFLAAPNLTQSNIKFTIVLNGTAVATNSATPTCSGTQSNLVQSANAQVTASYPCNLQIMGMNPVPNCTLTAKTTMVIQ
jgi:Flp pilus assembly protein TadG